jgi:c-di-GMP-binding flagellar brake protein YcgR
MVLSAVEVFMVGHKIILALQDARYPLRFHPWVRACDHHHLSLDLPDRWWQLATFLPDMRVDLTTVREDTIYGLKGRILEVSQRPPSLIVEHGNQLERVQRRTFYRLDHRARVVLKQAVLPEGNVLGPLEGWVTDISAGGLGLRLGQFLPPETVITIEKLLDHQELQAPEGEPHLLKIRWCRVHHPEGFRLGARFEFQDVKACDRMARLVSQLQVLRLARYQHLASSPRR